MRVAVDPSYDPPRHVVGNLRFTRSGVYADFLLDGLSVVMRSLATHERAARLTRNLGRNVPSGSLLQGLLVPDDQNLILRNMVGRYSHRPQWVAQCRRWQPVIAAPSPAVTTGYTGPVQRRHWLTVPVDSGRAGRTVAGNGQRIWDWVAGRDRESDQSVARYLDLAHEIVSALPDEFNITPATPAQIRWHRHHIMFRGATNKPLPLAGDGPDRLSAADFPRADIQQVRRRIVRVCDPDEPDSPVSFQTFLPVTHFPRKGLRFTRATYFRALDNVSTTAIIDWVEHLNVRTPDLALALNHTTCKNIKDQHYQRGPDAADDDELAAKYDDTSAYTSELKGNPTEREIDSAVLIAVGGAHPDIVEDAVKQIRQELDTADIAFERRSGSGPVLWKAFNPGSENTARLGEFRNPTTAHRWSRFTPLVSERVGNATGSALAVNQNTLRPHIILHDPEGAARRNHNTGLAVIGEPGGGKSNRVKLSGIECVWRGSKITAFDPGRHAEWAQAFRSVPGTVVIDPAKSHFSVDPLRIFPYQEAASIAADHILPMIGVPAASLMAKQFNRALRPDLRAGHGICSLRGLIEYLRGQPKPHDNELLIRLEDAAGFDYTPALFDDTRPPYRPGDAPATIWLTRNLALPDAADVANPHLYQELKPRQIAGMAIYGLLIDLEQQHMFANREQFSVMIFEECAELLAYTPGAKTAHKITRQGRKHNTGIWLITQDYRDLEPMGDKFVTQKWLFRTADYELAEKTLRWAGIDADLYPDVVRAYAEDTSPANTRETDDGEIEAGAVDPQRRGEGFMVDEFGRRARVKFFNAPTPELAADLDSTPPDTAAA